MGPSPSPRHQAVVGRTIQKVEAPARDPLSVHVQLRDGQAIQLLQQPRSPDPETSRSREFFASRDQV